MSTNYSASTLANLAIELDRIVNSPRTGTFTLQSSGEKVKAATETDVIKHLTTTRNWDAEPGRQFRFPGIGSAWVFDSAIEAAGYRRVTARTSRNQSCQIIIKA